MHRNRAPLPMNAVLRDIPLPVVDGDWMRRRRTTATITLLATITATAGAVPAPQAAQAAAGSATSYTFITQTGGKGAIARWDPCGGAVTYRVNLDRAPKKSLAEVKEAFRRVGTATGLTFRYAGATSTVPQRDSGSPEPFEEADVVVAWAVPGKQSSMLPRGATQAGQGGPAYVSAYTKNGDKAWRIFRGSVVLNATVTTEMARGFAAETGGTTGQLLMHEIGHAVGMGHAASDRKQIMYPMLTGKAARWGAGDLRGLRILGRAGGCLTTTSSAGSTPVYGEDVTQD
ncbi:hypothetical protein Acsp01_42030 [Actinoplanes sp. NBRC 101535]|nr:hypothetical protein Acsp01_42030 [Actinoplanes sp. NBRC 101535]